MKIAKFLLGIATFTATAAICAVCAGAATYGDYKYTYNDDDTLTITAYNGSETSVDIPSEIKGSRVTAIGDKAFYSNKTIQQVNIPDTVLTIGEQVFYNCDYLNNVKLSDNLTSLGFYAFASCDSLYNITIPATITEFGDQGTFSQSGLTTVTFEEGITKIGKDAFYGADKLKYVNIPDSVTVIEENAFRGCDELEEIIIPGSVKTISKFAFYDCDNLKTVIMLYGVEEEISAFANCKSIEKISYPESMKTISSAIYCNNLKTVALPKSLTNIESSTYFGNKTEIYCYKNTVGENYAKLKKRDFDYLCEKHSFGMWKTVKESTCTEIGYESRICADCGLEETNVLNKHKFVDTVIAPTYTSDGYTHHECSVCGYSYNDSFVDMLKVDPLTNVKRTGRTSESLTFGWNVSDNADGYVVEQFIGGKWEIIDDLAYDVTGYTANELEPSTVYQFRFAAYLMVDGKPVYSEYSRIFSERTAPTKPVSVKLTKRTDKSVTLGWNKNNTADGYVVQVYKNGKWTTAVKNTGINKTTAEVKGLNPGAEYKLRVMCFKDGTEVIYGVPAEITVSTLPSVVAGFKTKSKSYNSITLQWNKNTSATGYELQKWNGKKWVALTKITKNSTTTYTVKSLKASATYKYRIRAYKTIGKATQYSGYKELSVNTNPSNMSGFKAKSKSYNSITLQWNKNTSATGYELQKWNGKKWVALAKITKNSTTTYTVKSLKASATYKYRIRAYKTIGKATQYSGYKELSVNTNPSNMSGFKAKSKSYNSITLQWNKNTSATGYELQKWNGKKWVALTKITKNSTTTYTVKSLKASSTYKYRIRAYKTIGKATQYSRYKELSVNTNPSNMSGFKAKSTAKTSVTLQWKKNTSATGYEIQKWNGKKWVSAAKVTKNSTVTSTVKNLKKNTSYKFRIRAYKTIGKATQYSSWSGTLTVRTKK